MPRIAVIGAEGSGKTILLCTLAKRYNAVQAGRPALLAKDRSTAMYVERVWNYLQNQEWPPSTRPGELASLTWQFAEGARRTDIKMLDVAGQDLRLLFSEGRANSIEQLPPELAQIVEYVRSADIFLLLVNLADFLGENDGEKRLATEWTLRGLLDYVVAESKSGKHYAAVVFTQVDRFRAALSSEGGFDQLAAKLLPNLYGAYLGPKKCARFFVSAIGATSTEADASGAVRRVPILDGKTDDTDLNRLMNWISQVSRRVVATETQTRTQAAEIEASSNARPSPPPPSAAGLWNEWRSANSEKDEEHSGAAHANSQGDCGENIHTWNSPQTGWPFDSLFKWGVGVFLVLLVLWGIGALSANPASDAADSQPATVLPVVSRFESGMEASGSDGDLWDTCNANLVVKNNGTRATFSVRVWLQVGSDTVAYREKQIEVASQAEESVSFEVGLPFGQDFREVNVVKEVLLVNELRGEH